ncbi:MAG: hypothetical protein ACR2L3_03715, partial [Actinomycetota bacterium]
MRVGCENNITRYPDRRTAGIQIAEPPGIQFAHQPSKEAAPMPSLGRLGEIALTAGVNAALPVYSKIASKMSRLSDSTAGKVVGSVLEKGHEFTAPVVDTVLKRFLGG